ncbi:MAG TPA: carboxyltransferase domain-containing protein, partial [Thermoanaerobaculia bacterium]|nr:carboxyltransferase domain-containing protein [Thermoanaerobaculia bacterium]
MRAHVITMPVQILPAGDNATLVELGEVTAAELHAAAASVRAREGVIACIPGHSSLYVIGPVERQAFSQTISGGLRARRSTTHRVRVNFDGPDLPPGFVPRALTLTVRYLGFRGGFGYLDGWPQEWAMPRRPTSRPVVRGSFAVAGTMAGFYPIDTPGGW